MQNTLTILMIMVRVYLGFSSSHPFDCQCNKFMVSVAIISIDVRL